LKYIIIEELMKVL